MQLQFSRRRPEVPVQHEGLHIGDIIFDDEQVLATLQHNVPPGSSPRVAGLCLAIGQG